MTEACPLFTNQEYPLSLNRIEIFDAIFLGSVPVYGLEPKSYRVVFPRISQVPATDPNVTSTCILVYVDAANNVPEPQDGPANIAASDVGNADIVKCVCGRPPCFACFHPRLSVCLPLFRSRHFDAFVHLYSVYPLFVR